MASEGIEKKKRERKTGSGLRELLKLYRFLKPYRWKFALGMSFLLISSGASLLFPRYPGKTKRDAQIERLYRLFD